MKRSSNTRVRLNVDFIIISEIETTRSVQCNSICRSRNIQGITVVSSWLMQEGHWACYRSN